MKKFILPHFIAGSLLALLVLIQACAVNPVTGKKELSWMSEAWELQTGERYYGFQQQAGGGYYTIDPDLTLYVRSVGEKLIPFSARPHLPYEFVVLNDSTPNAWALPGGKIAINRGLLIELDNEAELAAVLAHEIVHADARHSAQSQEVGTIIAGGQILATVLLANSDHNHTVLQQGVALTSLYGQTRYSRSRELESDRYGMRYMHEAGYDPRAAISLQETFVRLSSSNKAGVFSTLFASHPPSQARVDANRASAAQLPAGGLLNRQRYQQEIAQLMARQPAYKKADKAGKAITHKNYRQALRYAQQAITMEPNESRFFELKGIALNRLNRAQDALQAYNKSITLDPHYFSPLLHRGLLRHELKSFSEAERDLKDSLKLAPTQVAYATLGEIAERKGFGCSQAIGYYQQAYRAGGSQNQEIQRKLAALKASCPAN